jgi:hypothetical protein
MVGTLQTKKRGSGVGTPSGKPASDPRDTRLLQKAMQLEREKLNKPLTHIKNGKLLISNKK